MYASGSLVDGEWMIYGCLYALRGRVARRLLRDMDWENMDALAPEDWTIGRAALTSLPAALARIDEPWSQRTPWSSWTAWCWYSLTASPERYASRFAVVTTGNPRLDTQPASDRARVMHLLADARERMIPEDVSKEDDEAVDWGDLLAACKGDAKALQ